jgi:hypothetical protein
VDSRSTGRFNEGLDLLKERLADPTGDRICESLRVAREVGGSDLGRFRARRKPAAALEVGRGRSPDGRAAAKPPRASTESLLGAGASPMCFAGSCSTFVCAK